MLQVDVSLGTRSYPIFIGADLLNDISILLPHLASRHVAIISNTTVWPLYGESLQAKLHTAKKTVLPIILPDGEEFKTQQSLDIIFDSLLENKLDRKTTLIALGGGVVGDITGFAAACYQRGVPFIQIPTTLLAQVDSSVGGKTAINHPLGKNMIGAFYQPGLVIIDPAVLSTLPDRELHAGFAEIIKYGLALDAEFFCWLETNMDALLVRDRDATAYAIKRCCEIKASVVLNDERETAQEGGRALLNLGHTFGHAIEISAGYGVWLHGEAVAIGCCLAASLSHQRGNIDSVSYQRAVALFAKAQLPTTLPADSAFSPLALIDHMGRDKKNEGGTIRFILLKSIGTAYVETALSTSQVLDFLTGELL